MIGLYKLLCAGSMFSSVSERSLEDSFISRLFLEMESVRIIKAIAENDGSAPISELRKIRFDYAIAHDRLVFALNLARKRKLAKPRRDQIRDDQISKRAMGID